MFALRTTKVRFGLLLVTLAITTGATFAADTLKDTMKAMSKGLKIAADVKQTPEARIAGALQVETESLVASTQFPQDLKEEQKADYTARLVDESNKAKQLGEALKKGDEASAAALVAKINANKGDGHAVYK